MRLLLTAAIFAMGLMYLVLGLGFLITPDSAGADFGLLAQGQEGLATMRADLTAFFVVGAGSMVLGAWRRNGDLLLVAAALFGLALLGRCISLAADGSWDGYALPMLVEGVTVIVTLVASRVLPHRIG